MTSNNPGLPRADRPTLAQAARFVGSLTSVFLSAIAITFLSYVLGHSILHGNLPGNDSPLHLAYLNSLDEYFPRIPHWFPTQGGGESLAHGYPVAAHLLIIAVNRLTGIGLAELFRLAAFLSFPLAAFGVYLLGWQMMRSQTVGTLAAIFSLLAPVTWTWMFNWGFFGQQVAFVLLPLVLLAFHRAYGTQLSPPWAARRRVWSAILVVLFTIASLLHFHVGAAAGMGMGLYAIVDAMAAPRGMRATRLKSAIKILILLLVLFGLIASAYLVPFYLYGREASRDGSNRGDLNQLHQLPILEFFGLNPIDEQEILTRMQFPIVLSIFAVLGIIFGLTLGRKGISGSRQASSLAKVLLLATIYALTPVLVLLVIKASWLISHFVNFRSALLLVMTLLPIVAAYGLWSLVRLALGPRLILSSQPPELGHRTQAAHFVRSGFVSIFSILLAGYAVVRTGGLHFPDQRLLAYGPAVVDLNDIWSSKQDLEEHDILEQLSLDRWPTLKIAGEDLAVERSRRLAALLPPDSNLRIDVSPYHGRLAMDLAEDAGASQINSYTFQISLIHTMWGYQQDVYFTSNGNTIESGNPLSLNQMAQWFGTEYVYINPEMDSSQLYEEAGWELQYEEGNLQLWKYPDAPEMVTATTRPAILVIGKRAADSYMRIFRLATDGLLPYEEALLVEGDPLVDSYRIEDLRAFEAIWLFGHDYKSSEAAWDLLAKYVAEGGNLFVETGWEFWIPEWEFEVSPDVLPVSSLRWTDYGMSDQYQIGGTDVAGDIDLTQFKPLVWEGRPWTLSGANKEEVRDWAEVILGIDGRPLIVAGEFGDGRVVWSGMNILAHATYLGKNDEEIKLVNQLLNWLTAESEPMDLRADILERSYPDRIQLGIETETEGQAWLYWREAYYPDWHAYMSDDTGVHEIPVYRAGPGFMAAPIRTGSKVVSITLEWRPSTIEKLSVGASVLGIVLWGTLLVDGLLLGGNGFTWVKIAVLMRVPRPFLGDGTNKAWAERKRDELKRGELTPSSRRYEPSEAIPWMHNTSELAGDENGDDPDKTAGQIHSPGADDQEAILLASMDDAGHPEDGWAERVLGPRKKAQES